MSKVLSIDYGTKKFGIAISDETCSFARRLPILYIKNEEDALKKIYKIINEEKVTKLIIGLPLNYDGTLSSLAKKIMLFSKKVKNFLPKINIITVDESITTLLAKENAKKMKYKRRNLDGEAARIMLQEYLDSIKYNEKK